MTVEHCWNVTDRGQSKYSDKNLSQCHFVPDKSHIDYPVNERSLLRFDDGE